MILLSAVAKSISGALTLFCPLLMYVVYTTHFPPKLGVIRRAIEFISDYTSLVVGAVDGIFKGVAVQARRNCVSIWTPAIYWCGWLLPVGF